MSAADVLNEPASTGRQSAHLRNATTTLTTPVRKTAGSCSRFLQEPATPLFKPISGHMSCCAYKYLTKADARSTAKPKWPSRAPRQQATLQ